LIAILAALGLSTSFWHLNNSRIGLEYALVPFLETLCFYLLWRGLRTGHAWFFLLSGFCLGLSPYAYQTALFLPLPLILFFCCRSWAIRQVSHLAKHTPPLTARATWRPLLMIGAAAFITFLPLGTCYGLHPDLLFDRARSTMFYNPTVNQGNLLGALSKGLMGNVGAFGFTGDFHPLANLPGRPILNPALTVMFWAGVILCLYRFKQTPFLFALLWWLVMLIPGVITPDRVPHHGRLLSVAPVTYIFPALAGDQALQFLSTGSSGSARRQRTIRTALFVALATVYAVTGLAAYHDYFFVWAASRDTYLAFQGPAMELAKRMNSEQRSNSVFLLPCDPGARSSCDYYSLDFFHTKGAPLRTILMTDLLVPAEITDAVKGKDLVHVVYLKYGKRKFLFAQADPKDLLGFLLGSYGRLERTKLTLSYDVLTYRLPSTQTTFALPSAFQTFNAAFGRKLLLESAAYGPVSEGGPEMGAKAAPGGRLWAVLQWGVLDRPTENCRTSLRLTDDRGKLLSQIDHILYDDQHRGTSQWIPEDVPVFDYYLLDVPSSIAPGTYSLQIGLYPPSSMQLVWFDGGSTENLLNLGPVLVSRP
jgi:hypothetical protein